MLIVGACAFVCTAHAAIAENNSDTAWIVQGEALARRIDAGNLIVTATTRSERQADAAKASGEDRLQILYDLAADDLVASDARASRETLAAFEAEIARQHDARYGAMAQMLRAYAPALDGDYLAARANLTTALAHTRDLMARAAGSRLLGYDLTDLGLFGNSLETASAALMHLPDTPQTRSLRSGLHDAMAYNALRVGDYPTALSHLQRTVDLDTASHKPIDGVVLVNNIASMFALAGATDEAQRLTLIHRELANRTGMPVMRFFADMLCAKVRYLNHDYAAAVECADEGRAIAVAPPEYLPRLLVYRLHALARLGRAADARTALNQLRTLASERGDPNLTDQLNIIEPEVLAAEGHYGEAFAALRDAHEAAEHTQMTRFNAGVRELRATMETEVAKAEERAQAQSIRSELQRRTIEKMTLVNLLVGACLVALGVIAALIYMSRRSMLRAVGRAEQLLARRGGAAAATDRRRRPMARLTSILDEIERRDIELKRAFEELEAARMAAEEANVAKSQFLTTMSHELRTPLNAIIGYCEMLHEDALDRGATQDSDDLSRIRGAAHRLLALINDVLDLSKIEAGRMATTTDAINVDLMIDDTVANVTPQAKTNRNTVSVERRGALGTAHTDGFKLSQCLLNLLSNAAKFTQDGQIKLCAARESDGKGDWLRFDVIDTGIGIAPETLERLFQPFMQADASTTRVYGGTGLGLAITRRLARILGGDVTVKSVLGQGAVFTLRVPADLAGAANAVPANDREQTRDAAA
ncbi:MAG: ATP-binding protein [Terricaulis sp.]